MLASMYPLSITPIVTNGRLSTIIDHTLNRLCAEQSVLPPLNTGKEAVASEYVSAVLTGLCLYFRNEHALIKSPQQELSGTYGRGPVDFVILLDEIMVCVTEVKRDGSLEQGLAQNIAQLDAALLESNKIRKRSRETAGLSLDGRRATAAASSSSSADELTQPFSMGIVSNASTWYLLRMTQAADAEGDEDAEVAPRIQMAELARLPLLDSAGLPPFLPMSGASQSTSGTTTTADGNSRDQLQARLELLYTHLIPAVQQCIDCGTERGSKRRKRNS